MFKLKFYAANAFYSSLIGLIVHVAAMFVYNVWHRLTVDRLPSFLGDILFSMAVGAIIGTVSLLFCFQILSKLTAKPWIGILSNFIIVALLNIGGAMMYGPHHYALFIQYFFHSIWFIALIVSEVLSFFLILFWGERIKLYKQKLEEKKAFLRSQGGNRMTPICNQYIENIDRTKSNIGYL